MADVYPPQEDSEFLASFVRKLARGKTLDMGTGSGIQAFAAMEHDTVTEVVAADINPDAVARMLDEIRKRTVEGALPRKTISVVYSDLFENLDDETFDTIICNPPYLPDTPVSYGSAARDIALDGGKGGFEWSERFLKEAIPHIAPNGQMIFLFSNLTNRERIDATLRKLGYSHEELGEMVVGFFERLYVYLIRRPA
jgi:release factor glutamine methyltransferase